MGYVLGEFGFGEFEETVEGGVDVGVAVVHGEFGVADLGLQAFGVGEHVLGEGLEGFEELG